MNLQKNISGYPWSVLTCAPRYKLYSVQGVMIATFFGTPLAGGYLISKNYQRLGNQSGARQALLYSLLVVIASLIAGYLLPDSLPSIAVSLPILLAIGLIMKQMQGPALDSTCKTVGGMNHAGKHGGSLYCS